MIGSKLVDTPMDPNIKLKIRTKDKPMDKDCYQHLVGKLIYLTHTRPDITFAVSCVSQFMHYPFNCHLDVVYKVLKYLKGTHGK